MELTTEDIVSHIDNVYSLFKGEEIQARLIDWNIKYKVEKPVIDLKKINDEQYLGGLLQGFSEDIMNKYLP